jgi:class 3 adenylate cyclase
VTERQLHERLRDLLPSAAAESCQVVASFLDIRGFSTFSARTESFDSALYLRSVYITILSSHFEDATFFKLTGDGLLLIHDLPSSQSVPEIVSSILTRAVSLVDSFSQITADDYMISSPVPEKLGVGIARGSATRLVSDGGVLDYTGRCLNLAARLTDKARPSGVVFADHHAKRLMSTEIAMQFTSDKICIRGISPQEPTPILITRGVEIDPSDREPIATASHVWGIGDTLSVEEVRGASFFGFYLPRPPRSYERVGVRVEYPRFDKDGHEQRTVLWFDLYGDYEEQPGGPLVSIKLKPVQDVIQQLPETTTSKTLGIEHTKRTEVTFTPLCAPIHDK